MTGLGGSRERDELHLLWKAVSGENERWYMVERLEGTVTKRKEEMQQMTVVLEREYECMSVLLCL